MQNHNPGLGRPSGQVHSSDSPFMGLCELVTATLDDGDPTIILGYEAADSSQRE
jgi:hypothetical protein